FRWHGSTSNSLMASKLARRSLLRFDCDRHSVFGDTRSAFLLSCVATMFAAPAVPLRRQKLLQYRCCVWRLGFTQAQPQPPKKEAQPNVLCFKFFMGKILG